MERKEYSAAAVKFSFWFLEFRRTVQLLSAGKSMEEIRRLCLEENLFAAHTPARAKMICTEVSRRVACLSPDFRPIFQESDLPTQKLFNLTAIMLCDTLFLDFIYEVLREKLILGIDTLTNVDLRIFFRDKQEQSEKVAGWKDYTLQKLGTSYKTMLMEAGILQKEKTDWTILRPILDPVLLRWLDEHDLHPVVKALEGARE